MPELPEPVEVSEVSGVIDVTGAIGGPADTGAPMRLRRIQRNLPVGSLVTADPDVTAAWPPDLLAAVLAGAGFEPVAGEVSRWRRERSLADTVAAGMQVLLVGLNPSPVAADVGVGFARPGNRFWPAALAAGLVTEDRDPERALLDHGVGMTDTVKRTTARADELARSEYVGGIERLALLGEWLRPGVICFVGLSGWRAAVDRRAATGLQSTELGGRPVYVMPNPSGLNAHVTTDDLADHFRAVLRLAAAV